MKRLLLLLVIGAGACEQNRDEPSAVPAASGPSAVQSLDAPASKPAPVVPKPQDQAQLDRMILAGYTPHADHLHAPGVNECPLTKGTDAVM